MSIAPRSLLFDPPSTSPLGDAVGWIEGTLFGTVAVTLCVLAVAMVGLMMLTGRLPVRRGMQVVLGCFVLLGAPVIAAAFTATVHEQATLPPALPRPPAPPRGEVPPADYDLYAGASLKWN